MNKKGPIPAEPELVADRLFRFNEETPLGEWHMHRFVRSYEENRDAEETTEFLYHAFKNILAELQNTDRTTKREPRQILNEYLPVTGGKKGLTYDMTKKSPAWQQAFEVELLIQRDGIPEGTARTKVANTVKKDKKTVRDNHKTYKEPASRAVQLQLSYSNDRGE